MTPTLPPGEPVHSAVPAFAHLKRFHDVPDFRLGGLYRYGDPASFRDGGEGGVTLESLGAGPARVAYLELGEKRLDAAGEVDNCIVIQPYYSGDATNMLDFWSPGGARTDFSEGEWLGPGKLFDTEKYYVVVVDALGLWGASRPASSRPGEPGSVALGRRFPAYRVEDCAQLTYRLLTEKLSVRRVRLATGVSFGATLTYALAALHPEFVAAALPIGGAAYQDRGMVRWLFDLMTAAIQSDPVWRETGGDYHHLPREKWPLLGNMFGWSLLRQSAFVDEYRVAKPFAEMANEMFDWEGAAATAAAEGKGVGATVYGLARSIDANDLIGRNVCQGMWNALEELGRVRARTLVVSVETDQWIRLHMAKAAAERIPGARLRTFAHDLGHYAVFRAPKLFAREIAELLEG